MDKRTILVPSDDLVGRKSSRPSYVRMVENFVLLWLDENINEINDEDYRNSIRKLREEVKTFTDIDVCIHFLNEIKDEKVILISSNIYGQKSMPLIHDMEQIHSVYIISPDKILNEEWIHQWSKIKGIYKDISTICQSFNEIINEYDRNCISLSFIDEDKQTFDQLDQSFMYSQILKEILLTIDFQKEHLIDFIKHCREQFVNINTNALINIDKLEQEYTDHLPIWWYTYPCLIYSILNRALRQMEINWIIQMGFFIRDLNEHLMKLYSESKKHPTSLFIVYRGQGLSSKDFNQLIQTKRGLISFNHFLSTSFDRQVSLAFAESNLDNPHFIGVLFQMNIDSSISSTPFANIRDVSYYQEEEEILFAINSIFRIGEIKQINEENNRLWQVDLTLTSDNDVQLQTLTECLRKESFPHRKGWFRLGDFLNTLGEFNKAHQVYEILLEQTIDDCDKADIFHQLGRIKRNQGEYTEAITFYEHGSRWFSEVGGG